MRGGRSVTQRIGLAPNVVQLGRDHGEWRKEFLVAQEGILAALETIPAVVEHVGSTAVPDLAAKPIIDIAIGLYDMSLLGSVITSLCNINYRYRGYRDDSGGHILDWLVDGFATRYVHVVLFGGEQWERYILFREYLKTSLDARRRYEAEKLILAKRFARQRKLYTASKQNIIDALIVEARIAFLKS